MSNRSPEDVAAALLSAGRPEEALATIEGRSRQAGASHQTLACHALILKALNRLDDCLSVRRRAVQAYPDSGVAWHNLASILGDLGHFSEAAEACHRAFRAHLDAPETWLVFARALAGEGRQAEAFEALDQALRRRQDYGEALVAKANLVWIATGDADAAAAVFPDHTRFALEVSAIYRNAGDEAQALSALEAAVPHRGADPYLLRALAMRALDRHEDSRAVWAAAEAVRLAPADMATSETSAITLLATGRPDEALKVTRMMLERQPINQAALALCATAARIVGAPEYDSLYDYAAFVGVAEISAPAGWTTKAAFLQDLKTALGPLHEGAAQPLGQSLRHGTQTSHDLRTIDSPVLKAFFSVIDPLIRAHMARLGAGEDPLRRRNTGDYAFAGCWSVRLKSPGYHLDHIHPEGWLSSAFYVEAPPEAVEGDSRAGWIGFGRPNFRTNPALAPAHFERPIPGRLVLFPSYMWHGTEPFTSPATRTTIAFDLVPR
jgi:tetratricopeptide (TPR) repeat protein